jgi:hypothetical protein
MAAAAGNLVALRELIKAGCDINAAAGAEGNTVAQTECPR